MSTIKKYYKQIIGVVGAILGLVFLRQLFTRNLRAKLNLANTEKESAVIDSKLDSNRKSQSEIEEDSEALRKAASNTERQLTPSQVEDFWKKQ